MSDADQYDLFVEQAEYLGRDSFDEWASTHPDEENILNKLTRGGAKLVTGPRGCGKTTLLLKAYRKALSGSTLPVYVNFRASLRLEPLYKGSTHAPYWFAQWMTLKILLGIRETLEELDLAIPNAFRLRAERALRIVNKLEMGSDVGPLEDLSISLDDLNAIIGEALILTDRSRCVLLLDDAAHAFSPEQQRDFFDFFRKVKSNTVAPKAAIYPGVTAYPGTFHAGHDAEPIDVRLDPHAPETINFLIDLLRRRLPAEVFQLLETQQSSLKLLCHCAFGVPRALLNMIRSMSKTEDSGAVALRLHRRTISAAIKDNINSTIAVYTSLGVKLPMYANFIEAGGRVFDTAADLVKAYNRDKSDERKSVTIAIKTPVPTELEKIFGFFQYSGLVYPAGSLGRGEKGPFELYVLHSAAVVDRNVLFPDRKKTTFDSIVHALEHRNKHEFTRTTVEALVGTANIAETIKLSLPPCPKCHQPRVNEAARFCVNCGERLTNMSTFELLVLRGIEELPLTDVRVNRIKKESNIKTIKDILMDHDNRELNKVKYVGPVWRKRIRAHADEFIS